MVLAQTGRNRIRIRIRNRTIKKYFYCYNTISSTYDMGRGMIPENTPTTDREGAKGGFGVFRDLLFPLKEEVLGNYNYIDGG